MIDWPIMKALLAVKEKVVNTSMSLAIRKMGLRGPCQFPLLPNPPMPKRRHDSEHRIFRPGCHLPRTEYLVPCSPYSVLRTPFRPDDFG